MRTEGIILLQFGLYGAMLQVFVTTANSAVVQTALCG